MTITVEDLKAAFAKSSCATRVTSLERALFADERGEGVNAFCDVLNHLDSPFEVAVLHSDGGIRSALIIYQWRWPIVVCSIFDRPSSLPARSVQQMADWLNNTQKLIRAQMAVDAIEVELT